MSAFGLLLGLALALNPKGTGPHCSSFLTDGGHACLENLPPTIPAEWVAGILEPLMYFCRAHWPGDYLKKKMLQDFLNLSRLKASTQPTPQLLLLWTSYSLMLKITDFGLPWGPSD